VFTNGLRDHRSGWLLVWSAGLAARSHKRGQAEGAQPSEAPRLVETGPVLENIFGERVNLLTLPVPQWRNDGGRYIGTWHINVTKDPETGTERRRLSNATP
jgi:UbiD family decarboxylase